MIRQVSANKDSFKTVEFTPGLNVVVAERTEEATIRDTVNGLGKSTLVDIIHFCLGSRGGKSSGLAVPQLKGWVFCLEFDVGGAIVRACRGVDSPKVITVDVLKGELPGLTAERTLTGSMEARVTDWNEFLGRAMFGLQERNVEGEGVSGPTFRAVIAFFARRAREGGYARPFETHRKTPAWQVQLVNAFLLGLGWEYAAKMRELKEQKRLVDELRRAARSGMMGEVVGSLGALETERMQLEERVAMERVALRSFRVHENYHGIEATANALTEEIHDLSNANKADDMAIRLYRKTPSEEREPEPRDVLRLYKEAQVSLPEVVVRRLEEVQEFHLKLVANRPFYSPLCPASSAGWPSTCDSTRRLLWKLQTSMIC